MIETEKTFNAIQKGIKKTKAELKKEEVSVVRSISAGTAIVSGLENAEMDEMLQFPNNILGMVRTLNRDSVGVVFLDNP